MKKIFNKLLCLLIGHKILYVSWFKTNVRQRMGGNHVTYKCDRCGCDLNKKQLDIAFRKTISKKIIR